MNKLDTSYLDTIYQVLADEFLSRFPLQIPFPRTVGREAELPVVTATGEAADVRKVWQFLEAPTLQAKIDDAPPRIGRPTHLIVELRGQEYVYTIEVGLGTMEINTRPCATLWQAKEIVEIAMQRLVHAAGQFDWRVLGYGIQPLTAPSLALMTPKQRYQSLYQAMGNEWLWYTVTASDQTHIAIARHEVLRLLNFGNLMTPVIIALCANSPVYAGKISPFCSSREGQHLLIHATEYRHGMPARPYADLVDFVRRVAQAKHLIRREGNLVIPTNLPFTQHLSEHGADFEAFLFHEHYIWNSARVRPAYGTIEIRPACQQPWREHMAVMALNVGLIEASEAIEAYVQAQLGHDYWEIMRTYHRQVVRHGLAAPQPAPNFLQQIATLAEAGLRQRNHGEEALFAPIYERLYQGINPAQRAQRVFAHDGLAGLLNLTAIRRG